MSVKKHINKQGISPLIATVLIIGFTVALAAIIINWGTSFTRNIQEGTESTTDLQIACAQDVIYSVREGTCYTGTTTGTLTLQVSNDGTIDIDNFIVRVSDSNGNTKQTTASGLLAFDANKLSAAYDSLTSNPYSVELIPLITLGGSNSQACGSNKQTFTSIPSCS